jgi:hypothetical protein
VGLWGVWWCGGVGVGGGFPLRSNIPRSALCATLDTYNFLVLLCQHRYFLLLSFDDRYLQTRFQALYCMSRFLLELFSDASTTHCKKQSIGKK